MRHMNRTIAVGVVLLMTLAGCASVVGSEESIGTAPEESVQAASTDSSVLDTPPTVAPVGEPEELEAEVLVGPTAPFAVEAVLEGEEVSIALSDITENVNTRFSVAVEDRVLDFMAYALDGEVFVRAGACAPCDSRSFALDGETLVCRECASRFDAWTGEGIDGACVDFPKTGVDFITSDGLIVLRVDDLVRVYDETLAPGSGPLVEEEEVVEEPEDEIDARPPCCR